MQQPIQCCTIHEPLQMLASLLILIMRLPSYIGLNQHTPPHTTISLSEPLQCCWPCGTVVNVVVQSPELWNPVLVSFYPTAAAASIAINVLTLQTAFQQAGAESFAAGVQGIWGFSTPKTPASWGYTVAIVLYIATGGYLD